MFGKRPPQAPASISDAIREMICEKNLTAYALGKRAGVSAGVIQRFLAGERSLTLTTADKLARTLNLELRERVPQGEAVGPADPTGGPGADALASTEVTLGADEAVVVGDGIRLVVKAIRGGSVRIAVFSPDDAGVRRGEFEAR